MLLNIVIPALAGLAVFLCGMKLMELALYRLSGPHLTTALQRFTETPLRGMMTGIATTAVLQSSTAVTVLAIGMVNAGLLTFARTLGIILGTNIGTCLTTELIGMNIGRFAVPLMIGSLIVWIVSVPVIEARSYAKQGPAGWIMRIHYGSTAVFGLGLLLKGITLMQSIGPHVQGSPMFAWFLERSGGSPMWGLAAGAVLTAAVHSSSAVIGMVMGLCSLGALPVDAGIAIVLGANIGTCVTVLLASIGGSPAGRFVAWSHILLNVGGAALFVPFTGVLQTAAGWITGDPAGQIAHAQTLFNVLSSLLAFPLCYLPVWRNRRPPGHNQSADAKKAA